jgi:hypothetical protein
MKYYYHVNYVFAITKQANLGSSTCSTNHPLLSARAVSALQGRLKEHLKAESVVILNWIHLEDDINMTKEAAEWPGFVYHREAYIGPTCPKCGSDYPKRFWLFGKQYCISDECELNFANLTKATGRGSYMPPKNIIPPPPPKDKIPRNNA